MRFVPTPQDFLKHIVLQPWMHNGVKPIDNPIADEFASLFLEKLRLQVKELERTEKKSEENLEFSEN